MTSTIFWRLAWKEYRQQRDLMLAIGIIAALILAAMLAVAWLQNQPLAPGMAYSLALTMAVFYALGCGATLFANEHERETFDFLRGLPLRGADAFWPKIAVAIASCLLLAAGLLLLAAIVTWGRPLDAGEGPLQALIYLVMMLVVLAWAVFYSLILRNPLWAVAAGGISFFTSLVFAIWLFGLVKTTLGYQGSDPTWIEAWIPGVCLALFAALLAVNVRLGRTWLSRESMTFALPVPAPVEEAPAVLQPATTGTMLWRLVTQWWREAWPAVAAVYGGLLLMSLLIASTAENHAIGVVWGCLPALLGSLTFFHDQWKQHYRFFAEHGVHARTVWWGRVLASISSVLPYFLALIAVIIGSRPQNHQLFVWPQDMLLLSIGMFVLGQLCSLLFRAGIVGTFAGTAAGLLLVAGMAMLRFLGIPDWLGLYLPTAVMLWASWYRAADWIADNNSWRHYLRYSGVVALPLIAWLVAAAVHRAYEIPAASDPTATVAGPAGIAIPVSVANQHRVGLDALLRSPSADELETARLYRELAAELGKLPAAAPEMGGSLIASPPGASGAPGAEATDPEKATQAASERQAKSTALVERFIEITRREAAVFDPDPLQTAPPGTRTSAPYQLVQPVLVDARRLTEEGDLDAALERCLALLRFTRHLQQRGTSHQIHQAIQVEQLANQELARWAGHPEQSVEAIDQLRDTLRLAPYDYTPDYDVAWMRQYVSGRLTIELSPVVWNGNPPPPTVNPYAPALLRWLPWERQRTRRWFDYVSSGGYLGSPQQKLFQNTLLGDVSLWNSEFIAALQLSQREDRAARELCLMLLAWRQEHGELPDSLGDLEAMYPGQVPASPATHRGPDYRPYGEGDDQRAFLSSGPSRLHYDLGPAKLGPPPAEMGSGAMGGAPVPAPNSGLLPGTY